MKQNGSRIRSLTAMALVALAVCCSSSEDPLLLTNVDQSRSVTVNAGREVDLTLQTIGSGQYGEPQISCAGVTFLGVSFPGPQNPGGPRQLFRFATVARDSCSITIPHSGDLSQTPPFTLSVVVQ